ncbi:MAG TPA: hypothetical protein VGI87_03370, partial [Solirubrobacteraceae bacterium]
RLSEGGDEARQRRRRQGIVRRRPGRPAYTGVVQATALAPTGVEAETRSKAALLSGPDAAPGWLAHGGVVVLDDGTAQVVTAAAALAERAHEARQAVAR